MSLSVYATRAPLFLACLTAAQPLPPRGGTCGYEAELGSGGAGLVPAVGGLTLTGSLTLSRGQAGVGAAAHGPSALALASARRPS